MPSDFGLTDHGVILFSRLFPFNQVLAGLIGVLLTLLIITDVIKYLRFRTREETLEIATLGATASFAYFLSGDLLLSALIFLFVSMVFGTIAVRKSEIWFKMTLVFTMTYGYVLGGYVLGAFILGDDRIFGITWVSSFWILLILSFVMFGRKYLLVSRFMSPNYVYLFLYILVYIFILQLNLSWEWTYVAVLLGNAFIYCISGWLLTVLFRVKPLDDPNVRRVVMDVSKQLNIKVGNVGIVRAPILNAFAYGSFFDQRIAFIADDLSVYDVNELKGITAHELAHLKRKHTLQLLGLSAVELFIKWLVGAPASYIDYAVREHVAWNFLDFYVFNFVIFVILLIYVRVLEAEADEITQQLGLGKELAEALYHLESFYQGIAGSMGLSVHLLTDKKRPHYQEVIDAGDAARQIISHATRASRVALLANLIMSHPPSAFRIVGVLHPEKFSKYKLALLPLLLLLPKLRSKYLQQLASYWDEVDALLTDKFLEMGYSLEEYVELSLASHQARAYVGHEMFAIPASTTGLPPVRGIVRRVKIGKSLMNAVMLEAEDLNDQHVVHEVSYFMNSIYIIKPGQLYFLKNGRLALLENVTFFEARRKLKFEYALVEVHGQALNHGVDMEDLTTTKTKTTGYLGFPLSSVLTASSDNPVPIILREGKDKKIAHLVHVELHSRFHDSVFHLNVPSVTTSQASSKNGEQLTVQNDVDRSTQSKIIEKVVRGSQIVITRGLVSFEARSLKTVFKFFKGQQIPLYLFLVNDPDNYIPCLAEEATDDVIHVKVGQKSISFPLKEVDGVLIEWPHLWQVQERKELGILGRLSRTIANRGTVPPFLK